MIFAAVYNCKNTKAIYSSNEIIVMILAILPKTEISAGSRGFVRAAIGERIRSIIADAAVKTEKIIILYGIKRIEHKTAGHITQDER